MSITKILAKLRDLNYIKTNLKVRIQKYIIYYNKCSEFEFDLSKDIPKINCKLDINIKKATKYDAKRLGNEVGLKKDKVINWLSEGKICLFAEYNTKIVAYTHFFPYEQYLPEIEYRYKYKKSGTFVSAAGVTLPEYRGKGVWPKLHESGLVSLKNANVKKVYYHIEYRNIPSLKAHEKFHIKKTGNMVSLIVIFGFFRIQIIRRKNEKMKINFYLGRPKGNL